MDGQSEAVVRERGSAWSTPRSAAMWYAGVELWSAGAGESMERALQPIIGPWRRRTDSALICAA